MLQHLDFFYENCDLLQKAGRVRRPTGWSQIKRHLVRTEFFAYLRTQLLRLVADLKAQGKLDNASTHDHVLRRLDLQAQKKKSQQLAVEDADEFSLLLA